MTLLRFWPFGAALAALCGALWLSLERNASLRAELSEARAVISTQREVQSHEDAARLATDDALIDLLSTD